MNDGKIGRNQPCPCGSGLKAKFCHLDPVKIQLCQKVAEEAMRRLIARERMNKGLIPFPWQCENCNQGFVTPVKGVIKPDMPMCPKCNSTNVKKGTDHGTN